MKIRSVFISNPINYKKAFLFFKNVGDLTDLGYPAPTLENLKSSTQSYINSLKLFQHPLQGNLPSKEQKKQEQTWKMISLLGSEFCEYKLNDIFFAAIQSIPTSKEEEDNHTFNYLKKNQGIGLDQNYMEQFWKWIGNKITVFPPDSILFLLKIWPSFSDFTLGTNTLGESVLVRKAPLCIKSQKELQRQYMSQYRLLLKFTESFFKKIFAMGTQELDQQNEALKQINMSEEEPFIQGISSFIQQMSSLTKQRQYAFELDSWECHFLNNFKNISYRIFTWRAKKMLPILQSSLKKALNKLQQASQELLLIKEIQRNALSSIDENSALGLSCKEDLKRFNLRNIRLNDLEREVSGFELLSNSLLASFGKQQKDTPTENQLILIEKNQRELIEEEAKANSSQEKAPLPLSSDSDSEIEEPLQAFQDSPLTSVALLKEPLYSFTEIDAFLKSSDQVDGFLSKTINGILKQLKTHLLKRRIDLPKELKALQNKKIHEIHAQLVLATTAQEQIIQAIQDQRWNHVVLGFRSTFIHCHFAVEQMLSLEILCKSGKIATTHNLDQLEKEANINNYRFERKKEFLRDIAMHLWFCYPGDYRAFYPNNYPKPFVFLEKLFHPYRGKDLDTKLLAEALQMCFTSYCQTIEFIAKASSSPLQNFDGFLERIKKIQEKTQAKINKNKRPNGCLEESSFLKKCKEILHILENINIPDFEEKHLIQRPLNTIKEYLKLMKLTLESPSESYEHSLQEFLQVEVLANMDKLFKHLFRTVILLQTGEDNHSHDLLALFQLAENFYGDILIDQDKAILKKINLSITHHYLHKDSHASLQKKYKKFFNQADKLAICSKGHAIRVGKEDISYKDLEEQKEVIRRELELAMDLFHKLLNPLIIEFEELNAFG